MLEFFIAPRGGTSCDAQPNNETMTLFAEKSPHHAQEPSKRPDIPSWRAAYSAQHTRTRAAITSGRHSQRL
jgi:hypothetical protein